MRYFFNFIVDQSNVRCIYGDITSHTAHGNTDTGRFESRSVVHTVTDHGSGFPAPLLLSQEFKLGFRKAVRLKAGDTL